jgi:hypothetical protein
VRHSRPAAGGQQRLSAGSIAIRSSRQWGHQRRIIAVSNVDIDRANVQINFTESEHESKLVADIPLAPKRPTRKPF